MKALVAETQKWLQSKGSYARTEQEGTPITYSNAERSIHGSKRFHSWGLITNCRPQEMMMGLKAKLPSSMLQTGIAGVTFLLLLLLLVYQIDILLSRPDADITEALQDMEVYAGSPTFNCSELGLKGEKVVVEGHLYHTFGSDASTCHSKVQQYCFRKYTGPKHFPSPKFLSRLRDYEAYHEKCTKGHDLTELAVKGDTPQGCKYLVWQAKDGMGNQLLSLVCAFVYSLLSDRAMLIATNSHIDSYMCNPFPLSSWLLPKDFPEPQLRSGAKRVHTYLDETLAIVRSKHSSHFIPSSDLPSFIFQAPKHLHAFIICCDAKRDHQFFCPTAQKLFSGSNWFFYLSHEYTLPGFYFIPEFREKLNEWFPRHDVFLQASRYLLNPENELWARISQFYKAHMEGVEKQIGIQPRSWRGEYNPSISRQILRCAMEEHLLPKTLKAQKVRDETTKLDHRHPNISVLVTSLRGEYKDNLALEYVNHPNVDGLDVDVLSASHEGVQRTGNVAHDGKAVMDIWLLSFMHDLVITPSSTFGSTASGLAGIVPLLFKSYGKDNVHERACGRTNVGGPCFIVYPSKQPCDLDPPQSSISDPGKMVPEVKYCNLNPGLGIKST